MNKAVLILGMHRSGTSVYSAAVKMLGFDLGKDLMESSEENPRGFFENVKIVNFNDRLLEFLGGRWDNPIFDGEKAINHCEEDVFKSWKDQALVLLQEQFKESPKIAIKDPRLCQLLPFWIPVLIEHGFSRKEIYIVYVARHPSAVVRSQQKRYAVNPTFYFLGKEIMPIVLLWYSLLRQAWLGSEDFARRVFLYRDAVENPEETFRSLAVFVNESISNDSVQKFSEEFIDPGLVRSLIDDRLWEEISLCFPPVVALHDFLQNMSKSDEAYSELCGQFSALLDVLANDIDIMGALTPCFSQAIKDRHLFGLERNRALDSAASQQEFFSEKLKHEKQAAETAISRLERERDLVFKKLEALEGSFSWRFTKPLRLLARMRKKGIHGLIEVWILLARRLGEKRKLLKRRWPRIMLPFDIFFYVPAKGVDFLIRKAYYLKMGKCAGDHQGDIILSPYQQFKRPICTPSVSVIVPSYNHREYLVQRLESIYNQSYSNYSVVLLDDCSSDSSREILMQYAERYPNKTTCIFNDENSGSPFSQWKKGISSSSGDLVWIAESDDWCNTNFLEKVVPFFDNEAVMLAYCRTVFVNGDTVNDQVWTIEEFLAGLDGSKWMNPFIDTAHNLVQEAWSVKNIIPNVSSAVFRRPKNMTLFNHPEWQKMRVCGDWVFYLHLVRGGLVGYTSETVNYYRQHNNNASVTTHSKDSYYHEHAIAMRHIFSLYPVGDQQFQKHCKELESQWRLNRTEPVSKMYTDCYSLEKVQACRGDRKPNILMAGYAFSAGGGETFPIVLANMMKASDFAVTFICFDQLDRIDDVRQRLDPGIPVVNNYFCLRKIVTDFGIEIIHSHHAWVDNTIMDLLPVKIDCGLVISMHGMYEAMDMTQAKLLLPRLVSRAGKLVYAAEKNLKPFIDLGYSQSEKLVKIGNALEKTDVVAAKREDLGIPEDAFVVCMVSRAIPEKGWEEALSIVKQARDLSERDIQLIAVGEGPEYDRLVTAPPPYVHYLGYRSDIRSLFATSDIGFLPTRFPSESFPLVIIDCLYAGRPMLATNLGEIKKMLDVGDDHLAGMVFDLENGSVPIKTVAGFIADLAADVHALALLRARVVQASEKFCPQAVNSAYQKVYTQLMNKKAKR